MKMRILAFLTFAVLALTACAPGQVPPASPQPTVTVNWGCLATAPCASTSGYVVYAGTVAAAGTCQPSTSAAYTQVGATSNGVQTLTYTPAVDGVTICAIVVNINAGAQGSASAPSNALAIPVYPGIPTAPNATAVAALDKPASPFDKVGPELVNCMAIGRCVAPIVNAVTLQIASAKR